MKYAAYGSNLHPLRLAERLPSAELAGTARLANWSLQFHKIGQDASAKCSILAGGPGIHVAIFEISNDDKARLDGIEGVGQGYDEAIIEVPGHGACLTYRASASHIDEELLAFDWYRDLVLSGARYHGFPEAYVRRIAAVEVRQDPDPERRERHLRLLERLG